VERLFAGAKANVVITSPPYASQRKYDESSNFRPTPPNHQYVEWFPDIAATVTAILVPGGSSSLSGFGYQHGCGALVGSRGVRERDFSCLLRRDRPADDEPWGWDFGPRIHRPTLDEVAAGHGVPDPAEATV
jgi:hypothetical protein